MKDKPTPPRLAWWLFQKFIPLDERKYFKEAMLEVFEDLYIRNPHLPAHNAPPLPRRRTSPL